MLISMDQRQGFIWLDGALKDWQEARPHVLTHALHNGSAVFEGERAYNGKVFHLRQHTERLLRSAELIDFQIPWSAEAIEQATYELLRANNLADAYIRPIAWRGSEVLGVSAVGTKIHLAIAAWDWPAYFSPEAKLKGIRLTISDWRRPPPDCAPAASKASGLYIICTMAKDRALAAGYDDALMLDWRGQVAEASGANIFFVIDGKLHTPRPDCFLDGITRQAAMQLARARGIEVIERAILPAEMEQASECFITGTAAEITPVREIAALRFGVGAITQRLMEDFNALTRGKAMERAA